MALISVAVPSKDSPRQTSRKAFSIGAEGPGLPNPLPHVCHIAESAVGGLVIGALSDGAVAVWDTDR